MKGRKAPRTGDPTIKTSPQPLLRATVRTYRLLIACHGPNPEIAHAIPWTATIRRSSITSQHARRMAYSVVPWARSSRDTPQKSEPLEPAPHRSASPWCSVESSFTPCRPKRAADRYRISSAGNMSVPAGTSIFTGAGSIARSTEARSRAQRSSRACRASVSARGAPSSCACPTAEARGLELTDADLVRHAHRTAPLPRHIPMCHLILAAAAARASAPSRCSQYSASAALNESPASRPSRTASTISHTSKTDAPSCRREARRASAARMTATAASPTPPSGETESRSPFPFPHLRSTPSTPQAGKYPCEHRAPQPIHSASSLQAHAHDALD